MAKRKEVHVVPWPGGWAVKVSGKLFDHVPTKAEAVAMAVDFCRGAGLCSLKIHDRKGRVQSERTYPKGSDPYPPKG